MGTNHKTLTTRPAAPPAASRTGAPADSAGAASASWLVVASARPTDAERRATHQLIDQAARDNGYVSLRVEFRIWHPRQRRSIGVTKESVIVHVRSGAGAAEVVRAVRERLAEGQR